jgi:hypothetical protein
MSEHRFEVRQEEDAVAERTITRVALIALVISVVAVLVSTALLGRAGQARLGGGPAERVEKHGYVAPQNIGLIEQTLIEHEEEGLYRRALQERRLESYGWVDRARGVAHIPIKRAMALMVEEDQAEGDAGPGRSAR